MNQTLSLDKLLIGDNPFNGVDHLSQARTRINFGELSVGTISRIIQIALESGASGISFSTGPKMYDVLSTLKSNGYDGDFGIYPVLPDVNSSVKIVSEKGMIGLLRDTFGKMDIGTRARSLVSGSMSVLTLDPIRMMKTFVNAQISSYADAAPNRAQLKSIFLHEIVTDLMVSLGMTDLLKNYVDFVADAFGVFPGFVTRNFPRFMKFISESKVDAKNIAILTPFNKAGFQMNPSREECERALSQAKDSNIITMSILASGYLKLDEAVVYLNSLEKSVSCVIGTSSEKHAKDTFSYLRSELK
ncbi:MAG: hypothetical protein JRN20_04410 [Nitrososphaerota archaeon]|jgi:hypothetical protein|nr:hypothetical protein [Nitrososphaerota archaeon]MDG6922696.1 hypothetical protein [Nitrososphaerota archaeon]